MVSPDWYCGLSMEVSSRSGVSALPSEYQPTSNCTEVIGPIRLARLDVEAIAAGLRLKRDPRRLVGGDRNIAVGDAGGRFDRLEFPIGILPIPLVAGFHLQQLVVQAVAGERLAVGR